MNTTSSRCITTHRIPLAPVPSAANSPVRPSLTFSKRLRTDAGNPSSEVLLNQPPPKKSQTIQIDDDNTSSKIAASAPLAGSSILLNRRANILSQSASLQKKIDSSRDDTKQNPAKSPDKSAQNAHESSLESIRHWQRHYRKAFPHFVFYFENIPDNARAKLSRQLQILGSREEKFFSKAVTHVITVRPIPPSQQNSNSAASRILNSGCTWNGQSSNQNLRSQVAQTQRKNVCDSNNEGEVKCAVDDARRSASNSVDILQKAQDLGIKMWALEKVQRMMTTMFDTDTGEQVIMPSESRRVAGVHDICKPEGRSADLSRLLQNEKILAPFDNCYIENSSSMISLRGYYIYVHDQDEKTRPIMVRDYPKTSNFTEGKWPQFRTSSFGRCPFVESGDRRVKKCEVGRKIEKEVRESQGLQTTAVEGGSASVSSRTRSAVAETAKRRLLIDGTEKYVLRENNNLAKRSQSLVGGAPTEKRIMEKNILLVKGSVSGTVSVANTEQSILDTFHSQNLTSNLSSRHVTGEPIASGIQPSNVTSNIRSQIVSSMADGTKCVAGMSKQVQQLQRKVLARNSGGKGGGGLIEDGEKVGQSNSSSVVLDNPTTLSNAGATGGEVTNRNTKRKAQEMLGHLVEEVNTQEPELARRSLSRKKRNIEREARPGYCENCRDKFNDFYAHILSRKHRKFAVNKDNWKALDKLLFTLQEKGG